MVSSFHHFRSHVLDGAAEGVGPPLRLVRPELPAQPEVGQHDVTLPVQKDVLQLNITINYPILEKKVKN